ncbi:hypothetical protein QO179_20100 [Bacillus stercoris]|nr:hypothetical protein [Bacillus stercoris]PTU28300.1 hypothetical protein DA469_04650 [Bacillus subtilis]
MENENTVKKFLSLDSAFIIGYISFMGYLMAYLYQKSYFGFFEIPYVFVNKISISNIFVAILSYFGFLVSILGTYNVLDLINNINDKPIVQRLKAIAPVNLIIFGVLFYFKTKIIIYSALVFLLVIYFYNFVLPLILIRTKGYNNKLRNFHFSGSNVSFKDTFFNLYREKPYIVVIIVVMFSLIVANTSGLFAYENANRQTEFAVTQLKGDVYIVFDIQDDKAIIGKVKGDKIIPKYKKIDLDGLVIENKTFKSIRVSK